MKVGDLVRVDYSIAIKPDHWDVHPPSVMEWQQFNGMLGVITDTDPEQGSVFVLSQCGVEEIHTCYLEVINESG